MFLFSRCSCLSEGGGMRSIARLACLTTEFHHGAVRLLGRGNRRRKTVLSLAVILLAFVCTAVRSDAQDMSTGALNITVTDSAGALIPGAKLVLTDLGTNDQHTV